MKYTAKTVFTEDGEPPCIPLTRQQLATALSDTDPMPFGRYKGVPMQDVPASYLHFLWTDGKEFEVNVDPVAAYISANLTALKQEHPDGIW